MTENAQVLMAFFTNLYLSGRNIPEFQQLYPAQNSVSCTMIVAVFTIKS